MWPFWKCLYNSFLLLVWIVILLHYVALITTTATTTNPTVSSTVARTTTRTVPIHGLFPAISIFSNTPAASAGKNRHGMILQHIPAILSDSKHQQSVEYSAVNGQGLLNEMLSKYQLYWLLHTFSLYLPFIYTHTHTYSVITKSICFHKSVM